MVVMKKSVKYINSFIEIFVISVIHALPDHLLILLHFNNLS